MRIGIFGGAFNPPHNGHLIMSILSIEYLKLDKLFIVPTFNPPHRDPHELAPFEKRYLWLEKIFQGVKKIEISDYEKVKGGKSYSIETVRYFRAVYGVKPYFIIGEDSAINFHKWYMYETLMREASFAVYPRFRESRYQKLKEKYPDFIFMDLPLIEISSTEIRNRIRERKSIRGMVPLSIESEVIDTYL